MKVLVSIQLIASSDPTVGCNIAPHTLGVPFPAAH